MHIVMVVEILISTFQLQDCQSLLCAYALDGSKDNTCVLLGTILSSFLIPDRESCLQKAELRENNCSCRATNSKAINFCLEAIE